MKDKLLKMNLQFFAEQDGGSDDSGADEQDKGQQDDGGSDEQQEEMIPKSQMEQIIKDRVAREKKAAEKAVEEAKRLAQMNQAEKQQYEFEQLQKELEELKRKDARYSMSAEATKMLTEHNVPVDEYVFEIVVKDTAEETKERVDWFAKYVTEIAEQMSKKALSGTAPKVAARTGSAVTKESIMAEKDPSKRIRLIQEHPELF